MRNRSLFRLCGTAAALITLSGASALADEKADTLLKQVAATTGAAKPARADLELIVQNGATVRRKKTTLTSAGQAQKLLNALPADARRAMPVTLFFRPLSPDALTNTGATLRYVGQKTLAGKTYRIVEIADTQKPPYTTRLYISPEDRVTRMQTRLTRGGTPLSATATLSNITLTKVAVAPPKPVPPAADAGPEDELLPVGTAAPRFAIPTPAGPPIALDAALKGRKAVLVNFWFYG